MPQEINLTYAALITIALPGAGESVTLTVTLGPQDLVELGGEAKPLAECTLYDLRRYADALEADVWDVYEQITLPELDADERVEVVVTRPGQEMQIVVDWPAQVLVFDQPDEGGMAVTAAAQQPGDDESAAAEEEVNGPQETAANALDGGAEAPAAEETGTEDGLSTLAVSESELVFPEIEFEVGEGDAAQQDEVIPSQARVRVAGARLPLGDPTWAAVDILMDEPALRAAQAHALSSLNREVAGVLIGRRPEKQPDGRYLVHIFDTIVAKHTVMQGASVTYTPESWRYLNDTLNERYPDETAVMVGWYHTHPGFGIFLSGMDLFIHQNFFTQIWHVAMVLDPQARTSGFFCWDRPKSRVSRYDFVWPAWAQDSW